MKNRIYMFLTYLVLISLIIAGISMSRYETTMTGSGEAVIGAVIIDYVPRSATLNGEPITASSGGISVSDLGPGSEVIYEFDIKNYKDDHLNRVLLKYKVSVILDPEQQTIPLTYDLTPDGTYQSAGDGWVLLGHSTEETHSYTLTIVWDEEDINPDYLNQQQVLKLKIEAEQTTN